MPRPRKFVFKDAVLFITTSLEEGLLFNPNPLINAILESALARAQALFPVKIVDFLMEPTHLHLILAVLNPVDVAGFMERFKTESAHAINRLLGRKKRTIWCAGYDSPILLTAEDVVEKIVYTLANPAKDGLEDSIEKYPGLSSLRLEKKGSRKICPWFNRWMIPQINPRTLTFEDCERLKVMLMKKSSKSHAFTVDRDAWMPCMGITEPGERREWREKIFSRLSEEEAQYRAEREKAKKKVIGRERLLRRPIDPYYVPARSGQRSWVISHDVERRKAFIEFLKDLIASGREVYLRWNQGDFSLVYPAGLYPPSFHRNSELLPTYVFG